MVKKKDSGSQRLEQLSMQYLEVEKSLDQNKIQKVETQKRLEDLSNDIQSQQSKVTEKEDVKDDFLQKFARNEVSESDVQKAQKDYLIASSEFDCLVERVETLEDQLIFLERDSEQLKTKLKIVEVNYYLHYKALFTDQIKNDRVFMKKLLKYKMVANLCSRTTVLDDFFKEITIFWSQQEKVDMHQELESERKQGKKGVAA
jgi:hypothetical protein